MKEFIVEETTEIFKKAIKKRAEKNKIDENKVSILLSLSKDEEREVEYTMCEEYQPVKKVGILEVLGVKFDFKRYSYFVPPQIKKILEGFEEELGSKDIEVGVFLNPEDEEDDEIIYFLFKEGQVVRRFQLASVLKI